MPQGIVTRTGNSPEPFNVGQIWNSFMNSSRTGVGTKGARNINDAPNPTPPIQPGGRPRGAMFMDPVGPAKPMPSSSSFMDPVAPADSDVTRTQGNPGRQIFPPQTGGTNANGVQQSGRNLSGGVPVAFVPEYANSSFNDLLARTKSARTGTYGSNQLPTTEGSPDATATPATQGVLTGIQGGQKTDQGIEGYKPPASPLTDAGKGVLAGIQGGQKTDEGIEGYKKGGRLDQALAGVQSEVEMTPERRQQMASMAFLNGKDSMSGLRAKEAVNGVVYAGGQHYISGESGDDQAVGISRDQARGISSGETNAQDLLKAHIEKNKDTTSGVPATSQNPGVTFEVPKDDSTSVASAGDYNLGDPDEANEFKLNNNDGNTGFDVKVDLGGKKTNFPLKPYK